MKDDNFIRDAIDESLSGVRFTQQDMRAVQSKTTRGKKAHAARTARRYDFAFALAALAIVLVPVALFTLRAQRTPTTSIAASPGVSAASQTGSDPQTDLILKSAAQFTAEESEAIRIARACFESVCDTSIFTFEEYAVAAVQSEADVYAVTMESIYGNGCRFTADVSLASSSVLRHSTPQMATVPAYLNTASPEVTAWYDRYGPILMTWPQDAQAEFSRRYEGGLLRTALPEELSAEEAKALALQAAADSFAAHGFTTDDVRCYPMLYSERSGGAARYVVYCFPTAITDTLHETGVTVTFSTRGENVALSSGTLSP